MHKLMLGQYGSFSLDKFMKDYRPDFFGMEICQIPHNDIKTIKEITTAYNLKTGIHFPLRPSVNNQRDPLVMSNDSEIRSRSFNKITAELSYIKGTGLNPEYILFHFPKPVIIGNDFNLNKWRFASREEYVYENEYSFTDFLKLSRIFCSWISMKGKEYGFIPILELDALNSYTLENDHIEKLLDEYNNIRLCIDIGRLHYQKKNHSGFNDLLILQKYLRYTDLVHIWNVKINETVEFHHYPLLPDLSPDEGWADIKTYFKEIKKENKFYKFLFEHRSDLVSEEELEKCYKWVKNLLE